MIFIETNSISPFYNFAAEYYLITEKKFDETVFLFWRTEPTLMLGKYQNAYAEIDLDYANANQIQIVRRMSGGGTIYTDMGGWQFTFISKSGTGQGTIEFKKYISPVVDALCKIGINASFNGRNDLVVEGRKFSGNAQYILNGYTLHHGSILFDTDIEQMMKSTTVNRYKMESKGIASVRDRVTNISDYLPKGMTTLEFRELFVGGILQDKHDVYSFHQAEMKRIREIEKERFDNWQSIFGDSPKCEVVRTKRFSDGILECQLNVNNGRIEEVKIYGDFFGDLETDIICSFLKGCKYERKSVENIFERMPYYGRAHNISTQDIVDTIMGQSSTNIE
ncbi:lipoate--protein ligase [Christensenella tenuis]|uniref:lipoate--protein ligase n=1 Tax=Christensenella tenuis TaxID=2763033 RepID=A0ABR7EE58_9FIRM|nr:lipoate--protein ligase [Christensenella tenuis]MBC5648059.1 lipoate--protein ligase [Christensenella tenuis]